MIAGAPDTNLDLELSDLIDDATGPLTDELKRKIRSAVAQSAELVTMASKAEDHQVRHRLFETSRVPLATVAALIWAEGKRRQNKAVERLTHIAIRTALVAAAA